MLHIENCDFRQNVHTFINVLLHIVIVELLKCGGIAPAFNTKMWMNNTRCRSKHLSEKHCTHKEE